MSNGARTPRVLFVCGSDFSSPSEKQVLWFSRQLTARGAETMVSLMGDPETASVEGADRVDGLRLIWPNFRGRRPVAADLAAVKDFRPDLIHAFAARVPIAAAAEAYSRESGAPIFVHWEDDEWGLRNGPPTRSPLRRLARVGRRLASRLNPPAWYLATSSTLRWAAKRGVAHDAVAPTLARYVEERLGRPCEVVLPAMAPAKEGSGGPPHLPSAVTDGRIVAYTGEIHPARVEDVKLAARAVALAQDRGLSATFVHAGGNVAGVDRDRLAQEAGLRAGTYAFLGHLPYAQIPPLLRECSALIQASRPIRFNIMGLPSKLQAYLASGTPVLASAAGAGELLVDRDEALKTHSGDPEELADRLCDILTDEELAAKLSRGGPRAAARLFDPVRNTDALIEHYRKHLPATGGSA